MTKMKKLLLFLILLTPLSMYSQGEASWWFFGQNASLDFNSGAPLPGPTGSLNTFEGCSTISDECGNLLMYSDGTTVWDRNGNAMPNGTGLSGNSSSAQSAIIIPDLGSTVRYFVITISSGAGLRYSIVDMSLNSGLGDVANTEPASAFLGSHGVDPASISTMFASTAEVPEVCTIASRTSSAFDT